MSSSGDESNVAAFPRYEYDAIEKAVMESARGRWFLQEFAKRNRAADTQTLLDAIARLQSAIGASSASSPAAAEIASLAEVIKSTRADIAGVRNDMLSDRGALADGPAIYAKIAEHAKRTANEIMAGTQRLQSIAGEIKAANGNSDQAMKLENDAHSFQSLAWSQDVLSQRIAKAMGLLSHVDDRIAAMTAMKAPPAIKPSHLKYFAPDESVFAPPPKTVATAEPPRPPNPPAPRVDPSEPKGATVIVHRVKAAPEVQTATEPEAQPPTQIPEPEAATALGGEAEKKRIVIIRRPPGEAVEIPLATELPERVA